MRICNSSSGLRSESCSRHAGPLTHHWDRADCVREQWAARACRGLTASDAADARMACAARSCFCYPTLRRLCVRLLRRMAPWKSSLGRVSVRDGDQAFASSGYIKALII